MTQENKNRLVGIDYARAFFSVCIVGFHLCYFMPSSNAGMYRSPVFIFSDFVNFYIFLIAVPSFFIISNYLFACRPYDLHDLSKRVVRCAKLVLFWGFMFTLIMRQSIFYYPRNITEAVMLFLSGYDTLYYFFVSLAILTVITHFAKLLSNFRLIVLAVFSTFIVGALPLIAIKYQCYFLAYYWNPINFLPYPFVAIIIQRLKSQNLRCLYWNLIIISLMVLAFFACMLDWTIYINEGFFTVTNNLFAIPQYTRPSVVLLAILVLVLVVNFQIKEFSIVNFMAKQSLALYCLHFFFISSIIQITTILQLTGVTGYIVCLIAVISICYLCSLILPYFLSRDLIR